MLVLFTTRCLNRARNQYINSFCATAWTKIITFISKFYLETVWTQLCWKHSVHTLIMRMRKQHSNFIISFKILIVKAFQIRHGCITTFIQNCYPTSNTTITTVYYWKILFCLLSIQIMGNFISNIFRINLCY